jgi:hypothetical protein
MRSFQTSFGSPIETHTSVYRKSAPSTPSSTDSVSVTRAPVSAAMALACLTRSSCGQRMRGATSRTSMPSFAAPMSSELPMLLAASPRNANAICSSGLLECSRIVRMSARIWVGWNSSVSPFQTGTPALAARTSTMSWSKPRYSMPS